MKNRRDENAPLSDQLNEEQVGIFHNFKGQIIDCMPKSDDRVWYNDSTLLRYLRANNWEIDKALKKLLITDTWREEKEVDDLYALFDVEKFEQIKKFYPRWIGRRDRSGRPILLFRLGDLTSISSVETLTAINIQEWNEDVVVLSEMCERYIFNLCSAVDNRAALPQSQDAESSSAVGSSISSCTSIIDMDGLSLVGYWKLRHHLQVAAQISSAHHPETVYTTAIVNAPSFFSTIWSWTKGWMDKGTQEKIFVLSKEKMRDGLSQIIELNDLPSAYGGDLKLESEDDVCLDEQLSSLLGGMSTPPRGPWSWENGKMILLGTVVGKPRNEMEAGAPVDGEEIVTSKEGE